MKPLAWLDRKFKFDFPTAIYPAYYERVIGTPARLEEFVSEIHPTLLTKKINGKWSIQEHIGHLDDLDELHSGRLEDFKAGKTILRPADMKNQQTQEADHNNKDVGEMLHSFRHSRQTFINRLNDFSDEELGQSALHERLNTPMRVVDLVYFVAEHDDHHMALMRELAKN